MDAGTESQTAKIINTMKEQTDILKEAARQQAVHAANLAAMGHELQTTFYQDLTIAELMGGAEAVRETFERVNKAWRMDAAYYGEFVIALNHKIWQHYETNEPLARVYNELWEIADDWAKDNYKGDDAEIYFDLTD